jgi:PST family polysaccharide transporter
VGLSGVAFGVLVATGVYYLLVTQMSLSLLPSLSWKELFIVHLPGVWSSAIIGAQMWGVAEALRAMNLPAILVLIITSAITATLFSALLYLKPSLVLGRDGLWMLQTLIDYLPNKIGNPLRKAFRLKSAVKNSGGPDDADGHEARGAATVPRPNTLD